MAGGRFRMKASASANAALQASTVIPFTAQFEEASAEGTAIGIVGLDGPYAGAITVALIDDIGGRVKLVGSQLQVGATSTNFDTHPTLSPIVEVTATAGGAKKRGTIAITVLDDGAVPATGMVPTTSWNGTAGTGFDAAPWNGTPPVATVKETVGAEATTCRMLQPDHLHISADMKLRVRAEFFGPYSANNKVYCHFEGNTYEAEGGLKVCTETNPRTGTGTISFIGYEWSVSRDDWSGYGNLSVYFEADPAEVGLPSRIIGPYTFYKKNYAIGGGLYDADLTVGTGLTPVAGSVFTTASAAQKWCQDNGKQNAKVTITVTGNYDTTGSGPSATFLPEGRVNWFTATGITATMKMPTLTWFRWRGSGSHFHGSGFVFDLANMTHIYPADGTNLYVFEGVTFTNSNGWGATLDGGTWSNALANGWAIGCDFRYMASTISGPLIRNCDFQYCANDIANSFGALFSNTGSHNGNHQYRGDAPTMDIAYSGAGTGTYSKSSTGWTLTDPAGTVTLAFATYPWPGQLAAAISARSGWAASALTYGQTNGGTSRKCVQMGGFNGAAISTTAAGASPTTISSSFDLHGDYVQLPEGATISENVIMAENQIYGAEGYTALRINGHVYGIDVVNNAIQIDITWEPGYLSLIGTEKTQKGVRVRHNTILQQSSILSTREPDTYSEWKANVFETLTNSVAALTSQVASNHTISAVPANTTSGTTGGTEANLFTSAATGNFTPAGSLLSNLTASLIKFDLNLATRAATDAKGAVKAA